LTLPLGGCGDDGVISRFMLEPDRIIVERKRCSETARLVDAGRGAPSLPLVKDNLQLEPEITNGIEDNLFVGLPGRDDAAADRQRANPATALFLDKSGRWGLMPRRWFDKQAPVLDDGDVEKV
jgi:hypothetical protein